jgi:hypothetical protein
MAGIASEVVGSGITRDDTNGSNTRGRHGNTGEASLTQKQNVRLIMRRVAHTYPDNTAHDGIVNQNARQVEI